jgi:hypothetical protein
MKAHIRLLRQRVRDSRYAVDEAAVADAVLARARSRRVRADRAEVRKYLAWLEQPVKQFRGENLSRSLRLSLGSPCHRATREH